MATIRDIAKRAGVSTATVSRAMREPDAVRPVKLERVRKAIEEMNYAPNDIARQLRRQANETIIVIVPEIANPFFSGIVQSIENVALDLKYRVLIGETQGKQERLDHYADMVSARIADGLILLGSMLPSAVAAEMATRSSPSIPLVLACERFDGLDCPNIAIDNVAAAVTAVDHLIATGRRHISTISGPAGNTLSEDRLLGYRQALLAAGLKSRDKWIVEGNFSVESGYTGMTKLLKGRNPPDSVFCANDEMAIGAQQAIRDHGLSIPRDIAVVGFDDLRFSSFVSPPLTTIRQPTSDIGETAMRIMYRILQGETIDDKKIILPYELITRGSTTDKY